MGSDLTVVNAARVSFNKESEWQCWPTDDNTDNISEFLSDKDKKLISYLAKHNHWTPFGHCSAQFRISAPIFVARQLVKHQVGLVWNEVSR
jgi:thymidylate synthase (FAD)